MRDDICEPFVVSDEFVTEVAGVEEISPNLYRVILAVRQRQLYDPTRYERVVRTKLIMSGEAMCAMSLALAAGVQGARPEFAAMPSTAVAN